MPRSRNLAFFVLIGKQIDRINCFIPCCACVRGVTTINIPKILQILAKPLYYIHIHVAMYSSKADWIEK